MSKQTTTEQRWIDKVAYFWWVKLPLRIRHISASLMDSLLDGYYLLSSSIIAAIASPIAFLVGLLWGWQHWGYTGLFSESLIFMMVIILIGVLSGHLGFMFLTGYILGDFFLVHDNWTWPRNDFLHALVVVRVPLLIKYALLSFILLYLPRITKTLVQQLQLPRLVGRKASIALVFPLYTFLTAMFVYFWSQMLPLLLRPIFTWIGRSPTVKAISPLQNDWEILVFMAIIAAIIRLVLQTLSISQDKIGKKLDAYEAQFIGVEPIEPIAQKMPLLAVVILHALWATLLLAGLYLTWLEAIIVFALLVFIQSVRTELFPLPIQWWRNLVERVPILFRLIVVFTIIYLAATPIIQQGFRTTNSFRPIIILTVIAFLLLFILIPGLPSESEEDPTKQEKEVTS